MYLTSLSFNEAFFECRKTGLNSNPCCFIRLSGVIHSAAAADGMGWWLSRVEDDEMTGVDERFLLSGCSKVAAAADGMDRWLMGVELMNEDMRGLLPGCDTGEPVPDSNTGDKLEVKASCSIGNVGSSRNELDNSKNVLLSVKSGSEGASNFRLFPDLLFLLNLSISLALSSAGVLGRRLVPKSKFSEFSFPKLSCAALMNVKAEFSWERQTRQIPNWSHPSASFKTVSVG